MKSILQQLFSRRCPVIQSFRNQKFLAEGVMEKIALFRQIARKAGIELPKVLIDGGKRNRRIRFTANNKSAWYHLSVLSNGGIKAGFGDYRKGLDQFLLFK